MDNDTIEELFQAVAPIAIKRVFGGKGVYVDGRIVGVILHGEMMLKGDAIAGPQYEEAGSKQWGYPHNKTGKTVLMPYWDMPAEAYDDPDEAAKWVRVAVEASRRAS